MKVLKRSALLLFIISCLLGCTVEKENEISENEKITMSMEESVPKEDFENPFEKKDSDNQETMVIGTIGHGMNNTLVDENGKEYVVYNGGEMQLDYFVKAKGMSSCGVGFLVFIDGMPQPYRLNNESEYEYMHILYPPEDEEITIMFQFVPVTGDSGDELELCVASVFYPEFSPDMKETSGYGIYHAMLDCQCLMKYEETPSEASKEIDKEEIIIESSIQKKEISLEERDLYLKKWLWTEEELNSSYNCRIYLDGVDVSTVSNVAIDEKDTIHLRLEVMGHTGLKCNWAIYINHQTINCSRENMMSAELQQGEVTIFEAEIDISQLDGFDTLYTIIIPSNIQEFPECPLGIQKTNSILLYRKTEIE